MNLYANISKQKIRKSTRKKLGKEFGKKRRKESVAFNDISNNV